MNNAKHTPGPWIAYVNPITGKATVSLDPLAPCRPLQGKPVQLSEADARLIASAPDLLKALEACLESGILSPLTPNTVRQARTAIAKARGNG